MFSYQLHFEKFSREKTDVKAGIYNLNFYFNDPYIDHQRLGIYLETEYAYTSKITLLPYFIYSMTPTYSKYPVVESVARFHPISEHSKLALD